MTPPSPSQASPAPAGDGLRVLFMGTPDFAVPTLRMLARGPDRVVAVVTQPDRPAGRKRRLTPPAVKREAERYGLPVLQPRRLLDAGVFEAIAETAPDVAVVVAFGKILRRHYLELPRFGCLNIHASLLPRWRGAAPINWAVAAGDRETGVTIQQIDEGLDTGPILRTWRTPIDPLETAGELHDRLAPAGAELMAEVLADLRANGRLEAVPQEGEPTTARMLEKADGAVDFDRPARLVAAHIRGMTPWPGAVCQTPRGPLKLLRAVPAPADQAVGAGPPGLVLVADPEGGLLVAAAGGAVEVLECQRPGRQATTAADFINGLRVDITGERWRHPGRETAP